jgi:hypothetical protein
MKEDKYAILRPKIDGNDGLREPQQLAFDAIRAHDFNNDGREVGIVLPVGCGKSGLIALAPFAVQSKRTLVVAPNLNIADQLYNDLTPSHEKYFYVKRGVLDEPPYPEPAEIRGSKTNISDLNDADIVVTNIQRLTGQLKPDKIKQNLAAMREALDQESAPEYERALSTMGTFLGADAAKPAGQGRCDSTWRWDTALWMTLEAKSEELADGLLPLKDIRQANTQLDHMASDQAMDHAPAGSPTVIVSDRLSVDPEHAVVANQNVYLTSTDVVSQIAGDVQAVWADLLATAARQPGHTLRGYVQDALSENGCLPTQVIDRLTQDRVRPGE